MKYLADPHFGRKFKNGVPKNRLGDREKLTLKTFHDILGDTNDDLTILGDVFDSVSVDENTLLAVYNELYAWADRRPMCELNILAGNHDVSRVAGRKTSFDVLSELLVQSFMDSCRGVTIIGGDDSYFDGKAVFYPFSYKVPNREMQHYPNAEIVCGHFDEKDVEWLAAVYPKAEIHSGHLHNYFGPLVNFEKSMLPLNYIEDKGRPNPLYKVFNYGDKIEDVHDNCVRILCKTKDEARKVEIEEIDALQIQVVCEEDLAEDLNVDDVDVEGLDRGKLIEDCLKDLTEEEKKLAMEYLK